MLYKKLLPVVLIGLGSLSLLGCSTQSVIKEYVYVMILFPLICWQAALDMMGLSWTTATSPKPTSQSDKP